MIGIALLLLAASIGHALARGLRIPPIPLLMAVGFGLGLTGTLESGFLEESLVLGITFLVFAAGVELDPTRVRQQKKAAFAVGLLQFAILGALGLGASLALGYDLQTGAYLALALTASSTLVAVRVLQRRRQLFEPFGRLVIGVLLLQDLFVILLIPVLTGLPDGTSAVVRGLGATLLLAGLVGPLLRALMPRVLERLSLDEELLLLVVLAHLFGFLGLAGLLGVPMVAAAFVAGVVLSAFPVNGVVRGQLTSIGDFFTAIFFTALGASIGLPTGTELVHAAIFAAVVVLVTPLVVAVVAEATGLSARPAIVSGLLLAQTSEFSLVVGLQGVAVGHLDAGVFRIVVLVTLATMMLTPLIVSSDRVALALLRLHPARRRRDTADPPDDHVLLLGAGSSGMPLLETLVISPHPVVVIDDDPQVVERIRTAGVEAFRGDAADPALLTRCGLARARVVVSTVRRPQDNESLLSRAGEVPVLVRAFEDSDAAWLAERGATPVTFGDAAAATFLEWYDRRGWEAADDLADEELEDVL